jgi:hypothetical protein
MLVSLGWILAAGTSSPPRQPSDLSALWGGVPGMLSTGDSTPEFVRRTNGFLPTSTRPCPTIPTPPPPRRMTLPA